MLRLTDGLLLAYALDTLDDETRALIDRRLADDHALRGRLAALSPAPPTSIPRGPSWNVPPSWARPPTSLPTLDVLADTLGSAFPTGDSIEVELRRSLDAHGDDLVVVLHRDPAGWTVLFPTTAADAKTLAELPRSPHGAPFLGVTITATEGRERWAVVLVPPEIPIDWSLPEEARWAPVRAALAEQGLVVESFEVEVSS